MTDERDQGQFEIQVLLQKVEDEKNTSTRWREAAVKTDKEALESKTLLQDSGMGRNYNLEVTRPFLYRGKIFQAKPSVRPLEKPLCKKRDSIAKRPVREEFLESAKTFAGNSCTRSQEATTNCRLTSPFRLSTCKRSRDAADGTSGAGTHRATHVVARSSSCVRYK